MRLSSIAASLDARRIERIEIPDRNPDSPNKNFGVVARALWPRKTAAELAFRANATERAAKFWLTGQHPPSARALMAVIRELI